jgi:hypothetical protein
LPGITARDKALVKNGLPKMGDLTNALADDGDRND